MSSTNDFQRFLDDTTTALENSDKTPQEALHDLEEARRALNDATNRVERAIQEAKRRVNLARHTTESLSTAARELLSPDNESLVRFQQFIETFKELTGKGLLTETGRFTKLGTAVRHQLSTPTQNTTNELLESLSPTALRAILNNQWHTDFEVLQELQQKGMVERTSQTLTTTGRLAKDHSHIWLEKAKHETKDLRRHLSAEEYIILIRAVRHQPLPYPDSPAAERLRQKGLSDHNNIPTRLGLLTSTLLQIQ